MIAKVDSDRKHPASIPGLNYKPDSLPGGAQVNGNQDLNLAHALLLSGERNGNPLQCSCLENPTDRGAWWAAVHGVTQSQTRLKRLSTHACMHWRRKWQPTPVFLPGESQGWWSLVGCHLWGLTESDMTEVTLQQQQQKMSKTLSLSSQCHLKGIYILPPIT